MPEILLSRMCITKQTVSEHDVHAFLFEDLTIVIIFADEDHWQVPQPSHVEGFKDLSLVGCAISVPAYVEVPSEGPFSIITAIWHYTVAAAICLRHMHFCRREP